MQPEPSESEDRGRGLLESRYDLICTHDMEGKLLSINPAAEKALGYPHDTLAGRNLAELLAPEVRDLFPTYLAEIAATGSASGVMRLRAANGAIREWEYHNTGHRTEDGRRLVRGIAHDVTEQLRAIRALRASEQRFRALFEQAAVGVVHIDTPTGRIRGVNRKCAEILGYSQAELLSFEFNHVLHPEDSQTELELMAQLERGDIREFSVERRLLRKDGSAVWVALSVSPMWNPGEKPAQHMVVVQDIAQRKVAEQALREKERLLSQSQRIARIGSFSVEFPAATVTWTEETYRLHGQTPATFVPTSDSLMQLVHAEDRAMMYLWFGSVLAGERPGAIEFRVVLPDGSVRFLRGQGETVQDERGAPARVIGTVQDITERKHAEAQRTALEAELRQAQKLEAIGTLAGGIAHDFNNILGVILGNLDLARLDLEPQHPAMASLDAATLAAGRATQLVRHILTFSRKQAPKRIPIRLGPVIEEAARLLRAPIPASIRLELHLDASAPLVLADATQIQQIVMNLCTNAWHAIEPGAGRIKLSLEAVALADAAAAERGLSPGAYARISVRDDGKGIETGALERIFEPFFTTKEVGRGAGLGLSVVHGIVEEHGGTITVDSRPGDGSMFEVLLPATAAAVSAEAAASAAGADATAIARARGRVLYIDDEPALADSVARLLTTLEYEATVCLNGREALELIRLDPARFDVVVTDFNMPGMCGTDVAREIAKIRPDLPVVLASGYADQSAERLTALGIRYRLDKPFGRARLSDVLNRIIATPATREVRA